MCIFLNVALFMGGGRSLVKRIEGRESKGQQTVRDKA